MWQKIYEELRSYKILRISDIVLRYLLWNKCKRVSVWDSMKKIDRSTGIFKMCQVCSIYFDHKVFNRFFQ